MWVDGLNAVTCADDVLRMHVAKISVRESDPNFFLHSHSLNVPLMSHCRSLWFVTFHLLARVIKLGKYFLSTR